MSPQLTAGDAARVLNGPAMAPIRCASGMSSKKTASSSSDT
jgi:hypothetical protein